MAESVEQWGCFEAAFQGPDEGNPFMEVQLSATFQQGTAAKTVDGFYDGDGTYRIRFMPQRQGKWTFITHSNVPELTGQTGEFTCTKPTKNNHGPVSVTKQFHFAYADGTHYSNFGTTCYGWMHQPKLIEQTLFTLEDAPFNKLRMCIFPKSYRYNLNEPERLPFPVVEKGETTWPTDYEKQKPWKYDLTRFNAEFFKHIDRCVRMVGERGIEADLIVFHPYDRWNLASLPANVNERYIRYLCARLSAYRHVWWSMCNEWDLDRSKSKQDWRRLGELVVECDPYNHLRSIHNCRELYDHTEPWVTHVSFQGHPDRIPELKKQYAKPVVVDECCYEGNIPDGWGNISGREMTNRFWEATCFGGYCGHGETFMHPEDILWWSKGGVLHGESPQRIAFLRNIVEQNARLGPFEPAGRTMVSRGGHAELLVIMHVHQPVQLEQRLPTPYTYKAQVIDPWEMTITDCEQLQQGRAEVPMPVKPHLIVRFIRADYGLES